MNNPYSKGVYNMIHIAIFNPDNPNHSQDVKAYNCKEELINSILYAPGSTLPDNVIVICIDGKVINEYKLYFGQDFGKE